jgi:hypothetical protein
MPVYFIDIYAAKKQLFSKLLSNPNDKNYTTVEMQYETFKVKD